jgi:hypothetical protein
MTTDNTTKPTKPTRMKAQRGGVPYRVSLCPSTIARISHIAQVSAASPGTTVQPSITAIVRRAIEVYAAHVARTARLPAEVVAMERAAEGWPMLDKAKFDDALMRQFAKQRARLSLMIPEGNS